MRDTENKLMIDDYSAITNISYISTSYTSFRYKGIKYVVEYCNNGYYYLACGDEVISKTEERMSPDIGYCFNDVGVRGLVGLLAYMGLVRTVNPTGKLVEEYRMELDEIKLNYDDMTFNGEAMYDTFVDKLRKKIKDSIRNVEIICAEANYIRFRCGEEVYSATLGKIDADERKRETCAKLISYNRSDCYVDYELKVVKNDGKEKTYGLNVLSFIPSFKLERLHELDAKTLAKLVDVLGIIKPNRLEYEANKLLDSFGSIIEELDDLKDKKQQLFNELVLGKVI